MSDRIKVKLDSGKIVTFLLEEDDDGGAINLKAVAEGDDWEYYVLTIEKNGRYKNIGCLPKHIGLDVDAGGKIKEDI